MYTFKQGLDVTNFGGAAFPFILDLSSKSVPSVSCPASGPGL
jgi:hypothetical protein